jgi:predicted  nucleic acid-binding Zn-ribbon protein
MARKMKKASSEKEKTVSFAVHPEEGQPDLPFDAPSAKTLAKQAKQETQTKQDKQDKQDNNQQTQIELNRLKEEVETLTSTNREAMQQTAQLSATVQAQQRTLRELVPSINQLITALEVAQQKGTFTLKQAAEVYQAIQSVSSLLQS